MVDVDATNVDKVEVLVDDLKGKSNEVYDFNKAGRNDGQVPIVINYFEMDRNLDIGITKEDEDYVVHVLNLVGIDVLDGNVVQNVHANDTKDKEVVIVVYVKANDINILKSNN